MGKGLALTPSIEAYGKVTDTWNTTVWPLPSHGSPRYAPYLFHTLTRGLHLESLVSTAFFMRCVIPLC